MKKKFNFNRLLPYLKIIFIITIIIFDTVIGAQYGASIYPKGINVSGILLLIVFVLMILFACLYLFVPTSPRAKTLLYAFTAITITGAGLITGNEYFSILYCLLLTEAYVYRENFPKNFTMATLSWIGCLVAFIIGWCLNHKGASDYTTATTILLGCLLATSIFAFHFIVVNFIVSYANLNRQLTSALKQSELSQMELSKAYEKLAETAVYEERNRIAKDIHDTTGHAMTSIIMQTEAAKMLIDSNPEEAKKRIVSANVQAKTALEQMRDSVHLLAGRSFHGNIKEAVDNIVAQMVDGTDIKIMCDIDEFIVSDRYERLLSNAIKECLVNGIRHGGATAFYIELKHSFKEVTLLVSDNGNGGDGVVKEGFGLTGMRRNIEYLGGKLVVKCEKDEGYEVTIVLPEEEVKTK